MTTRRLGLTCLFALLIGGCASASTPAPGVGGGAGGSSPGAVPSIGGGPGGGAASQAAAGGDSLAVRAQKVTDACTLLPTDLAAKLVPGGAAPQSQKFPPFQCTVSNQVQVLQITVGGYDSVGPVNGAEPVSGLGSAAYYEASFVDDAYLTIDLSPDEGAIYVEVAGHDGKDHKADAIAVAQYVLAHLQ